jgi:hypothetical protein
VNRAHHRAWKPENESARKYLQFLSIGRLHAAFRTMGSGSRSKLLRESTGSLDQFTRLKGGVRMDYVRRPFGVSVL